MASTSRGLDSGDDSILLRPPAALYPDRQTFSRALQSATQSLSLAQRYESHAELASRYELAYPLFLSAATGFLWAHKNIHRAGISDSLGGLGDVASGSQSSMSSIVAAVGPESTGESARVNKLKETFMRQAKKALQRAERIHEAKGAEWSRRWAGRRGFMDVDAQAKVLYSSAEINGLRFDPWVSSAVEPPAGAVPPLPLLSARQVSLGAHFQSASQAFGPAGCCVLDPARQLTGIDITQDAITNCGLVAAMEVMAEHDARRHTSLLRRMLGGPSAAVNFTTRAVTSSNVYSVRLHLNGCLRQVSVDDRLPFYEPGNAPVAEPRLMSACVRSVQQRPATEPLRPAILLPALIEKACLSMLRSYAPPGSVPAEDLHLLTGWLPEVIDLSLSATFQRDKIWRRLLRGWSRGQLLLCAGTRGASDTDDNIQQAEESHRGGLPPQSDLIPGHSYAILSLDQEQSLANDDAGEGRLTIMNPWRPVKEDVTSPPDSGSMSTQTQGSAFQMSWYQFCRKFATMHLAWDPTAVFAGKVPQEVHAAWRQSDEEDFQSGQGTAQRQGPVIRNVNFKLQVTLGSADSSQQAQNEAKEGDGEIWLHLCRHLRSTPSYTKNRKQTDYIAIHVFGYSESGDQDTESSPQASRIVPLGGNRQQGTAGGVYVDTAHHLVRFKPSVFLASLLGPERPGLPSNRPVTKQYNVVVSLHRYKHEREGGDGNETVTGEEADVNFTLRAWSTCPLALDDLEDEQGWSKTIYGSWTRLSSGGHQLHPSFHQNPQYLVVVPPGTPAIDLTVSLCASPPLSPIHVLVAHAPPLTTFTSRPRRLDRVERADVVAHSGAYACGLAKVRARLPLTPATRAAGGGAFYVIVLSTYHPDVEAEYMLALQAPIRINVSPRPLTGRPPLSGATGSASPSTFNMGALQEGLRTSGATPGPEAILSVYPLPQEGAGMFLKREKARWSTSEGTAGGAPRFGAYGSNPRWLVRLGRAAVAAAPRPEGQDSSRTPSPPEGTQSTFARAVFRLVAMRPRDTVHGKGLALEQLDSSGHEDDLPPINLSLFALPLVRSRSSGSDTQSASFPDPLCTTGPYVSSPTGVALHEVRLERTRAGRRDDESAVGSEERPRDEVQEYLLVASAFERSCECEFEMRGWCEEGGWTMERIR